jgi:putative acyl-CoA dehydrogenase
MGLDVLRAFGRDGEAARGVLAGLAREAHALPGAADAAAFIADTLSAPAAEAGARAAVERLAQLAAAAALTASASEEIAGAFARTRLSGRRGLTFGTGGLSAAETRTALERALP